LAGRPFDDGLLLRVAYAYEQATPWHTRRPPI
jgi:Asp-tRNA(Asn)/Glu-tRNA(Gln) amidotransferase A subunit family amidase